MKENKNIYRVIINGNIDYETLKEQLDMERYNYNQLRNSYNNLLQEDN